MLFASPNSPVIASLAAVGAAMRCRAGRDAPTARPPCAAEGLSHADVPPCEESLSGFDPEYAVFFWKDFRCFGVCKPQKKTENGVCKPHFSLIFTIFHWRGGVLLHEPRREEVVWRKAPWMFGAERPGGLTRSVLDVWMPGREEPRKTRNTRKGFVSFVFFVAKRLRAPDSLRGSVSLCENEEGRIAA